MNNPGFDNDTPLHDAVANGHHNIVALLLRYGADINTRLVILIIDYGNYSMLLETVMVFHRRT